MTIRRAERLLEQVLAKQSVPSAGPKLETHPGVLTTGGPYFFASAVIERGITIFNPHATAILLVRIGVTPYAAPVQGATHTIAIPAGMNTGFLPCTDPSIFHMLAVGATIVPYATGG
jgi:hypothetical protein